MPTPPLRFVALVCLLAAAMANPFAAARVLSADGHLTSLMALVPLCALPALLCAGAVALWSGRLGRWAGPLLALSTTVLMLAGTVAADRAYGRWCMPPSASLLFPPFSTAVHSTDEFSLHVRINNLGFRGPDIDPKKITKRVLVVGDSFTFGWGVPDADTWVQMLDSAQTEVEVLNLGRGGAHPGDHVQLLRKALPLLRPDLVVVGILQANDLNQLMRMVAYEDEGRPELPMPRYTGEDMGQRVQRYLFNLYPNLLTRFRLPVDLHDRWQYEADNFGIFLTDSISRARYHALPDPVRKVFHAGRLNPSLVFDAVHYPTLYLDATDTASVLYSKGVLRLHDHLAEMRDLCQRAGSQLVVLSLPNRPFICAGAGAYMQQVGQGTGGRPLPLPLGDEACLRACGQLGLRCITFTDRMRPHCPDNELFFALDGHWNVAGNRTFGRLVINTLPHTPEWRALLTSSHF
jgi:hypothetical protein